MSVIESKTELFTVADTGDSGLGSAAVNSRKIVTTFERYIQPCLAEMVGCTLFIFVGCGSVIENAGVPGSIQPALAHGLALAIVIAVLGEISGGHFNPAVSVSVCVSGGLDVILLGPYILSQIVGGMTGAGLAKDQMVTGVWAGSDSQGRPVYGAQEDQMVTGVSAGSGNQGRPVCVGFLQMQHFILSVQQILDKPDSSKIETILRQSDKLPKLISKLYDTKHVKQKCEKDLVE